MVPMESFSVRVRVVVIRADCTNGARNEKRDVCAARVNPAE
jgi:hypothetical protein